MLFDFKIIVFECEAVTYLYNDVNSCDRQSSC